MTSDTPPVERPTSSKGLAGRRLLAVTAAVTVFLAAVAGVVRIAAPASAQAARTVPPDRVTVTADGPAAYRLAADLLSGGIVVTDNVSDYATDQVFGHGTVPGSAGGTATVDVHISRAPLGMAGTLTLQDPGAAVEISAPVSGGLQTLADGTVTWQGTGTVRQAGRSSTQPVTVTIEDRHPDPGNHAIRVTHAGQQRFALIRLPDNYDGSPRPALFHFPGLGETPSIAEFYGRMADFAQTRGIIQVTPEHHGSGWQGALGGVSTPDVDDPGFITQLQDVLVARFNADPRRLYASGMSNGGLFTSKMACLNHRFAAYAPVSGQLMEATCQPGRRIPIVLIHGDADPLLPYTGGPVPAVKGAVASAEFWARNNGCDTTTTQTPLPDLDPNDNTTVVRFDYNNCPPSAPVVLYQIKGGGHNWPGGVPYLGTLLGPTTQDINGNQVIWDFVSRFTLAP